MLLNNIVKLGAFFYLLNNFLFSITLFNPYANIVFLSLVCVFLFFIIIDIRITKDVILNKIFRFYFFANVINVVYFVSFDGMEFASLKYLAARFVGLTIFSLSIFHNFEFYKNNFLKIIVYLIGALAIISLVLFPLNLTSGTRYMGLIGNPNELGIIMAIGTGILYNLKFNKFLKIILLWIFVSFVLYSGSRGALLGVILAFLVRHGFNVSFFIRILLFLVLSYFITSLLNIHTGIDRFLAGDLLSNRIDELEYALISLKNQLYTGYGLSNYSYIDQSLIDVDTKSFDLITAHNGYLAILVQYGIVFGFLFFVNLILEFFKILKFYFTDNNKEDHVKVYLFFIFYAFLSSFFESIMGGINNILTSLFWFSFAYLSYYYNFHIHHKSTE